jgi:predicted ATPase
VLDRWRLAKGGEGQLVLLTGEAGIGKSRITSAATEAIANEGHFRIDYQCSPYHTDSALHPAIRQLAQAAGFASDDSPDVKLEKLSSLLAQIRGDNDEPTYLIAALLGLETAGFDSAAGQSPGRQRTRTLEAMMSWYLGLAHRQPVLLVLEDAQWADPTSLELIELMLDRIGEASIFFLVTARPEFAHELANHPAVTRLALNRLGRLQIEGMIARLSRGKALPEEVVDEIITKTDGIPLFVEELTKTVLEADFLEETADAYVLCQPLDRLAIPSTLNDSLMARLDRLRPIKEVAQLAACIGREFDYRLMAAISPLSDEQLQEALDQLVGAELVFRRGAPPDASFTFKHALVRDAAHESLLKSKRAQLHGRIAEVLEKRFSQRAEAEPELIARHFAEAGRAVEAVGYYQRALDRAQHGAAKREARSGTGWSSSSRSHSAARSR